MLERQLYPIFQKKIKEIDPNCFCYKIPDWIGGTKRPFDFFLVMQGIPFAIEFKSKDGSLLKYQSYKLTDFISAGGEALIFWQDRGEDLDKFIKKIMERVEERNKVGEEII